MKNKIIASTLIVLLCLSLSGWSWFGPKSTFNVQFIDVGQGDAALIECDGQYMLIDGGDTSAGDKVYKTLYEMGVQRLSILAVSHLHSDHIGGLTEALKIVSSIDTVICNSQSEQSDTFKDFSHQLSIIGSTIHVPNQGEKYALGRAEVEVIYADNRNNNDSLVLLITYGKTRFLFTGDIEQQAQKEVVKILSADPRTKKNGIFKINLIKMPHHGAYNDEYGFQNSNLNSLLTVLDPDYAIISVGANNRYRHPHEDTLNLLKQLYGEHYENRVFRTDNNGDIVVTSNKKTITVTPSK